jgi:hypothetical protein
MQIATPFFTNTRGLTPIVGTKLMIVISKITATAKEYTGTAKEDSKLDCQT